MSNSIFPSSQTAPQPASFLATVEGALAAIAGFLVVVTLVATV